MFANKNLPITRLAFHRPRVQTIIINKKKKQCLVLLWHVTKRATLIMIHKVLKGEWLRT